MCKVAFVVLHYETLEDTENCVKSLMRYIDNGEEAEIVVVDNGSPNGKLIDLPEIFQKHEKVHLLFSDKNLGFAKGNNLGFLYAKEQLHAEIIILANNDLIFKQEDFLSKLIENYEKTKFDVAGPRIISQVDGLNQNPVPVLYPSIKSVYKRLFNFQILYVLSYLNLDTKIQNRVAKEVAEFYPGDGEDFQLHGACLFFGTEYIKKFDGLYEKTFMYGEESILKFLIDKNNMKMLYFDNLCVEHKEGSSTGAIWGKGRKKRQFYYRWNIHSCRLLKELMKR